LWKPKCPSKITTPYEFAVYRDFIVHLHLSSAGLRMKFPT
jgi:hypothetical protein